MCDAGYAGVWCEEQLCEDPVRQRRVGDVCECLAEYKYTGGVCGELPTCASFLESQTILPTGVYSVPLESSNTSFIFHWTRSVTVVPMEYPTGDRRRLLSIPCACNNTYYSAQMYMGYFIGCALTCLDDAMPQVQGGMVIRAADRCACNSTSRRMMAMSNQYCASTDVIPFTNTTLIYRHSSVFGLSALTSVYLFVVSPGLMGLLAVWLWYTGSVHKWMEQCVQAQLKKKRLFVTS